MAESDINNPKSILDTATIVDITLMTQSGWTIGSTIVFRNDKPTVTSGVIIGERNLTTDEINAINNTFNWSGGSHLFAVYTTNSYIANLSGKRIRLNLS